MESNLHELLNLQILISIIIKQYLLINFKQTTYFRDAVCEEKNLGTLGPTCGDLLTIKHLFVHCRKIVTIWKPKVTNRNSRQPL